ncbi:MAG: protein kinase, partial [Deltaproteobacteria bacterium]|nr:protein kinase [Deltaproteobacteria bacterium]
TQYCDGKRMAIGQRLQLFLAACSAVRHAHQKGVIHRDLKPSNVLVMEREGTPLPKVIDFGIAKATGQWTAANTLVTQLGEMVGTPEYASPEQANVTAGAVDETSDVYSLGAVLYELLIGTVPFDLATMQQTGLAEMLRIIREEEAPPLLRKLTALGAATADIAARRQTDAASLRRIVAGDLNWVVMKALEKARDRRYSSISELAGDIQRYIEHRPVLASPSSRLYRARKFIRRHRPAAFATTAGLAFVILGGVTVWSFAGRDSPPGPKLTERHAIVLADFTNATGDPVFDGLRQVMAEGLGTAPSLSVLPAARVSQTLRLMVRPADAKLTPDVAAEICERTGSSAVIEGSITSVGSEYGLGLRARNCQTGDVLEQEQALAAKKDEAFKILGRMVNRFGTRVGESLPPVEPAQSLPAEVTTPSLEAWKSFSAAIKAERRRAQAPEVVSLLKRAIEIDPEFAMAHAYLGGAYGDLGESGPGSQNIAKSYELRDRVSDKENYFISFNYHRHLTGNLELARQILESWEQKYPGDLQPRGFLSGLASTGLGHYEQAIEEGLKAVQLEPGFSFGYENVAFAHVYQNRLAEADAVLRKAAQRKLEAVEFSICRYFIAFLRSDKAAMETEVTQRRAKTEAQGWFDHQEALTFAYQGQLKEANRLSEGAINLARQAGMPERAAMFAGARAAWNALYGIRGEAQRSAAAGMSIFRSRDA